MLPHSHNFKQTAFARAEFTSDGGELAVGLREVIRLRIAEQRELSGEGLGRFVEIAEKEGGHPEGLERPEFLVPALGLAR